jgi:7-cyano-7-deazaguanine synthase in queuosine biosynthesis
MTIMNYFPLPPEVAEIPLDDYTGALAFSGGVESTALMAHLKSTGEKFVAFNLAISLPRPPYGPIEVWMAKQRINAKQIAEKLGVPLMEVDMQMTNLNTVRREPPAFHRGTIQRWYIRWYLALLTVYNPEIKNLYYGFHNKDSGASADVEAMLSLMAGNSKFKSPLAHLSKKEQWDLIPKDVQPLVLTCHNGVCGECFKCQERLDVGVPLE